MTGRWTAGERRTFATELDRVAAADPARTVAVFDDVAVTAGDLHRRVGAVANSLLALGVAPGDGVALFMSNGPEFVDIWFAAAQMGALTVPVNTMFAKDFLAHQLRDSGTKAIVVDAALAPRLVEIADVLPELRLVILRGGQLDGDVPASWAVVSVESLYHGDAAAGAGGRPVAWDEPATVFYTSGTTGLSKGAVVTQQYMLRGALHAAEVYGISSTDVTYGAVPLFHVGGAVALFLPAIVAGSTSIIDSTFHVSTTWKRVVDHNATIFSGVGPMVMMLMMQPPDPIEEQLSLRLILAAPIPPDLHAAVEARYRCPVRGAYGMTEAFPMALQPPDAPAVAGSAGKPTALFDVRILDDDGDEVGIGEPGEIVCRPTAPHAMFEGYLGRPADTLGQIADLWFHTGDFGRIDADGNLFFIDRKKDAIRRRGENISSFEVEAIVRQHDAVADCAVHAVPSDVGEDDVKVCVILVESAEADHPELAAFFAEHLPRFAAPRYIEVVTDFPRTAATGRVQKNKLREQPFTAATWDRDRRAFVGA